eukprot:gene12145-5636_t
MDVIYEGANAPNYIMNFDREVANIIMNVPELVHTVPFASVTVYFLVVMILPKIWGKRVLPGIKFILTIWNGFLALLSIAMFLGISYRWFTLVGEIGLEETVCSADVWKQGDIVFWTYVFAISKYIELFDTLWLILNGKPVPFLHWWHHITVLLFTWYSGVWYLTIGFIFAFVNALVHSFMYTYYFLMAIGIKPSWAKALTLGQISQMVVGIVVNGWFYYKTFALKGECHCLRPDLLTIACAIMYGSYLFLFTRFYFQRYTKEKKKAE